MARGAATMVASAASKRCGSWCACGAEDTLKVPAAGAVVVVEPVTLARLPPLATRALLNVAALVVMAVLRLVAPVLALVLDVVVTLNVTATPRRTEETIVTSLAAHCVAPLVPQMLR